MGHRFLDEHSKTGEWVRIKSDPGGGVWRVAMASHPYYVLLSEDGVFFSYDAKRGRFHDGAESIGKMAYKVVSADVRYRAKGRSPVTRADIQAKKARR